jgi:hypothetical protein
LAKTPQKEKNGEVSFGLARLIKTVIFKGIKSIFNWNSSQEGDRGQKTDVVYTYYLLYL